MSKLGQEIMADSHLRSAWEKVKKNPTVIGTLERELVVKTEQIQTEFLRQIQQELHQDEYTPTNLKQPNNFDNEPRELSYLKDQVIAQSVADVYSNFLKDNYGYRVFEILKPNSDILQKIDKKLGSRSWLVTIDVYRLFNETSLPGLIRFLHLQISDFKLAKLLGLLSKSGNGVEQHGPESSAYLPTTLVRELVLDSISVYLIETLRTLRVEVENYQIEVILFSNTESQTGKLLSTVAEVLAWRFNILRSYQIAEVVHCPSLVEFQAHFSAQDKSWRNLPPSPPGLKLQPIFACQSARSDKEEM